MASWSTELWDQFNAVATHEREGMEFLQKELEAIVRGRAALEKDYAKKLQGLVKSSKSNDSGTVNAAWMALKRETEAEAKAHMEFADRLTADADNMIKSYVNDSKKTRADLVKNGTKLQGDVDNARKVNEKNKAAYATSRKKKDDLQRQLDRVPNSSDPAAAKITKKLVAESKAAEKHEDAYRKSVIKLQELEGRLYESEMPGWLQRLQEMEVERIGVVSRALSAYCEGALDAVPAYTAAFEAIRSGVNEIDPEEDIVAFQSAKRTGMVPPERTEFEPYDSSLGTCRAPSGGAGATPSSSSGGGGSSALMSSTPAAFSGAAAVASSGGAARVAMSASTPASAGTPPVRPAAAAAAASSSGDEYCRGKYNYVAQEASELSFNAGDVIKVLRKDPSGWWYGALNGVQGDFPSNHIEPYNGPPPAESAAPAAAAATADDDVDYSQHDQCTALYEYKAEDDGELSLAAGDVLTVEEEDDQGWYYGHNIATNAYGRYPSNYVQFNE